MCSVRRLDFVFKAEYDVFLFVGSLNLKEVPQRKKSQFHLGKMDFIDPTPGEIHL